MADDGIQAYFAKFGLDASEFLDGLNKSQSGILAFYRDVSVSLGATMMIFDKVMGYGQKFVELANAATEFQSAIDKLTVTTGMSTTELYKWSNVARYADSDVSSLSYMIRKLSVSITEAGDAGDKARAMLTGMHVSLKNVDGSARSMNEIFPDVIEGLRGINDAGTKNTVAMTLFGRSFQDLAGYMLMSKSEMQGYFDKGFAPTSEQQQMLRDYEQAIKDLNTTTSDLSMRLGVDLAPALKDVSREMDTLLSDGAPLDTFFKNLNVALQYTVGLVDDLATGWAVISEAMSSDADRGDKIIKIYQEHAARIAQRQVDKDAYDVQEWAKDNPVAVSNAFGSWHFGTQNTNKNSDFVLPASSSKKDMPKSYEIARWQNDLETTQKVDIPNLQVKINTLTKEYNALSDKSTDAAKAKNRELIEANLHMKELNIKVDEYNAKLKEAGAPTTATGGATYNTKFATSLKDGGVPGDAAGYSDLANMTADQLQAVIDKAQHGGSKGMAEKAATYLSMIGTSSGKGSSGSGSATGKTAVSPADQSKTDTTTLSTELSKQADLFGTLNDKIAEGWLNLEKVGVDHWKALDEEARITYQNIMDNAAAAINFAGSHPVIQKFVVLSKSGYDIDPSPLPTVSAAGLAKAADFSTVKFSAGTVSGQGSNIKVDVTVKDQTSGGIKADVKATDKSTRESWASASGAGGTN